jgi:hypothetical protein
MFGNKNDREKNRYSSYSNPFSGSGYVDYTGSSYETRRRKEKERRSRQQKIVAGLSVAVLATTIGAAKFFHDKWPGSTEANPAGTPTDVDNDHRLNWTPTPEFSPTAEITQVAAQPSPEGTPKGPEITPTVTATIRATLEGKKKTETPTPTPEQNTMIQQGSVTIEVNKDGLPVEYSYRDKNGELVTVQLDKKKMQQLQWAAKNQKTPQLITHLQYETDPHANLNFQAENDPLHSEITKPPENLLTKEQLANRGITIIQSDTTQLSISIDAFNSDGLLSVFTEGERIGNISLTIVLVDAPTITYQAMSDKRYDGVRDIIKHDETLKNDKDLIKDVKTFRKNQVLLWQASEKKAVQNLINARRNHNSPEVLAFSEESLINNRAQLEHYKNASDQDLIAEIALLQSNAAGLFAPSPDGKFTLFLPVGKEKFSGNFEKDLFYFDSNGKLNVRSYTGNNPVINFVPDINGSYPGLDNLRPNPNADPNNPDSYPYGAQDLNFDLNHEIGHMWKMVIMALQDIAKDNTLTDQQKEIAIRLACAGMYKTSDSSEYRTDMWAKDWRTKSWQKHLNGDNSGYPFFFSVPGGGFMAVENLADAGNKGPDLNM